MNFEKVSISRLLELFEGNKKNCIKCELNFVTGNLKYM